MNFTIENIKEFGLMLDELDAGIQKEVLKKGYQQAAKPLIQQARENLGSNNRVKESIGIKYYADDNSASIGARTYGKKAGFMAPWFEEGTVERKYISKGRKNKRKEHRTGKIVANHFFSRAIEATEGLIFDNLYKTFVDAYNKIISKYSK